MAKNKEKKPMTKKAKRNLWISICAVILVIALVGGSVGFYFIDKNHYKKIASPQNLSSYSENEKELVNDATFYVSTKGNDSNDGSFASPFRTIKKAQEEVRKIVANDSKANVVVAVMAGEYNEAGITFSKEDSGENTVYTSYGDGEVIINGGMSLNSEDFVDVSGDALERIPQEQRENVKMLDLNKYGIDVSDYGEIKAVGAYSTENYYDNKPEKAECEIFFNSQRMNVARYPNDGFLTEGEVLSVGDPYEKDGKKDESWLERRNQEGGTFKIDNDTFNRVSSWKSLDDVWMFGYFFWDWADMSTPVKSFNKDENSITTEYCSKYGFKEGGKYYFFNVLEELDTKGEYYIDRENNVLYIYPPEDLESADIMISLTTDNVLKCDETAKNVTIDGFTIEGTRGNGVAILGESCEIKNCVVKNAAGVGVEVRGTNNKITNSEVCFVGKDAVILGGEHEEFTKENNVAQNCLLHDFGQVQKTYISGVTIKGAYNKATHNEIFNAPHMGISLSGNNNEISYNNIHDVVLQSSDAGAIYTGFSLSSYGNVVSYNCIHDIGSGEFTPSAIYFDDNSSGQTAYGNVLINIPSYGFLIGGGRDNQINDNLIINAKLGFHYDDRVYDGFHNDGWYKPNCEKRDGNFWKKYDDAKKLNEELTQKGFTPFEGIERMNDDFNNTEDANFAVNPAGSNVTSNVIFSKYKLKLDVADSVYKYSKVENNPCYTYSSFKDVFKDAQNGNYTLLEDSEFAKGYENILNIPFSEIGRQ